MMKHKTLKESYIVFDVTKLRKDVDRERAKKGLNLGNTLANAGVNRTFFYNSHRNYVANEEVINKRYAVVPDNTGFASMLMYDKVIEIFGLDDVYKYPNKVDITQDTAPTPATVEGQISSDELRELNTTLIMLTKAVMRLTEAMPTVVNTVVKPKIAPAPYNRQEETK